MKQVYTLLVNGEAVEVAAPAHWSLLEVLRYELGLTGSKQGCDKGDCGACTLHVDGRSVLSCITLAADVDGREGAAPYAPHAQREAHAESRQIRLERPARQAEVQQRTEEHIARDARKGIEMQDPPVHLARGG